MTMTYCSPPSLTRSSSSSSVASSATSQTSLSSSTISSKSAGCWLDHVEQHIRHRLAESLATDQASSASLLIGICGIPGSGKSVSSRLIQKALDDLGCVILPMDGYHLYRHDLSADQLWRRGAPDTFDTVRMMDDLHRIRDGSESHVVLPGFEHADGDPRPNQHEYCRAKHRVVLCEGLYLLHQDHGFDALQSVLDWTIFVDAPMDVCLDRVKLRNQCIPDYQQDSDKLYHRVDTVDRTNAQLVQATQHRANLIVPVGDVFMAAQ